MKKILKDMLINLIASSLPLLILQIIIFPLLSKELEPQVYGLFILVYSLINMVTGTFATSLNNIRLLNNQKYENSNQTGDFPNLLVWALFINTCIVSFLYYFIIENHYVLEYLSIIFLSLIICLHDYFIVEYRLELKFIEILKNRIVMSFGFILGYFIYCFFNSWIFVLLVPYFLCFLYVINTTEIWKEKIRKTNNFNKIRKEWFQFSFATSLLRINTYADKIILFPLLGGYSVSSYFAATTVSKLIVMIIDPINSVVLSHISKLEEKPVKLFKQVFLFGLIFLVIFYYISLGITDVVLAYLYPDYYISTLKIIEIITITTMVQVLSTLIQPFILKFCQIKHQITINFIETTLYLILSLLFFYYFELIGFCLGILISKVIKVLVQLYIFKISSK